MTIVVLKEINEDELYSLLLNENRVLEIVNVDEIKKSTRKENQYYFYVDYRMEDGTRFGISYSFYLEDGVYKCGSSSKLFYLLKGFLGLNPLEDKGLTFDESDISEILLNKKFIASAIVQSVGGKNYQYIICEKVME